LEGAPASGLSVAYLLADVAGKPDPGGPLQPPYDRGRHTTTHRMVLLRRLVTCWRRTRAAPASAWMAPYDGPRGDGERRLLRGRQLTARRRRCPATDYTKVFQAVATDRAPGVGGGDGGPPGTGLSWHSSNR
jgi:hypothetical protein